MKLPRSLAPLAERNFRLLWMGQAVSAAGDSMPLPAAGIMAVCVVGWAGVTFLNEVWFATVPQLIPQEVLARANSFDWLLSIIAMPLGFAVSGPVADHIGIPTTLLGAAALMAGPCILITFVPGVRHVKRTVEGTVVMEAV